MKGLFFVFLLLLVILLDGLISQNVSLLFWVARIRSLLEVGEEGRWRRWVGGDGGRMGNNCVYCESVCREGSI